MKKDSYLFIVLVKKEFQKKFYTKILEKLNAEIKFFSNISNIKYQLENLIGKIDLIIVDSYDDKEEIKDFFNFLKESKEYILIGYPFIFIEHANLSDDLSFFKQMGAKILTKPINETILTQSINDFLHPTKPKLFIYNSFKKKPPVINVRRTCPICDQSITIGVIDPKKIFTEYDEFFLPYNFSKKGFLPINPGDEIMICQYCLFASRNRNDFISDKFNNFEKSIYYQRTQAKEVLSKNKIKRLEFFNQYYYGIDYFDKKAIGLLGTGGDGFLEIKSAHIYLGLILPAPRNYQLRIFAYQLLMKIYKDAYSYIHSDESKKIILLEMGNNCLRLFKILRKQNYKEATEYLNKALQFYQQFIKYGISYHVFYRIAIINDFLFDLKNNKAKKEETIKYLSYIYTAAHQKKSELYRSENESMLQKRQVPKELFRRVEEFYQQLREKLK